MKKRDIFIIIGAISFLALIISLTMLLGNQLKPQACGCPHVISHNFIWLFILLAGIFVSSLVYYLFSFRIDAQEKVINKNAEILYSILDEDEKKALKKIISGKGELLQSELSQEFGKIKSHRIIRKLQEKGLIDVGKDGKTNKIKLKQELRSELK